MDEEVDRALLFFTHNTIQTTKTYIPILTAS